MRVGGGGKPPDLKQIRTEQTGQALAIKEAPSFLRVPGQPGSSLRHVLLHWSQGSGGGLGVTITQDWKLHSTFWMANWVWLGCYSYEG